MIIRPPQKPLLGLQINCTHSLTKRLKAAFVFNEGSGDRTYDSVARKSQVITSAQGWKPGGISFVTSGSNIECGAQFQRIYDGLSPFSIFVRGNLNVLANGATSNICGTFQLSGDDTLLYFLDNYGTTEIRFRVYDDWSVMLNVSNPVSSDVYEQRDHDLVLVWDGVSKASIYLNGSNLGWATENINNVSQFPDGNIVTGQIGNKNSSSTPYNGTMHCSYFWERELSQSEIVQLHQSPYAMFEQPRKWWFVAAGGLSISAIETLSFAEALD